MAVLVRKAGLAGVFAAAAQDHREIGRLIDKAKATRDATRLAELWSEIRVELLAHERAETSQIFSVLERHPLAGALARYHRREAAALEHVIDRLGTLDTAGGPWYRLFRQLADTLEQHAAEEEREIFPKAQRVIGRQRAEELVLPFRLEKKRLKLEAACEVAWAAE
jgi:hemerythrin superfamily protein